MQTSVVQGACSMVRIHMRGIIGCRTGGRGVVDKYIYICPEFLEEI